MSSMGIFDRLLKHSLECLGKTIQLLKEEKFVLLPLQQESLVLTYKSSTSMNSARKA